MKNGLSVAEWCLALLTTLVVIVLLLVRTSHAGALWRDECGSVQLALQPTLADVWQFCVFEGSPILFPITVRGFVGLFGESDTAFRCYGLLTGLLLVAALWFNAWVFQRRPPLLTLSLIGLSTLVLTWATSVRSYGPGSAAILFTFGSLGQYLRTPSWRWFAISLACALVSVQLSLYNCFLLLALCPATAIAALAGRRPAVAVGSMSIGGLCGTTMIPAARAYLNVEWNIVAKAPIGFDTFLMSFCSALATPTLMIFIWGGLFLATSVLVVMGFRRLWPQGGIQTQWLIYAALSGWGGAVLYFGFLKIVSYPPPPWYFLILICFLTVAADVVLEVAAPVERVRWSRLILTTILLVWLPFSAWPELMYRQTNIDLVCMRLKSLAGPEDLVIVNPWYYGISFNWYYDGPARWETLPILGPLPVHRYDRFKERMMMQEPLEDLFGLVRETLKKGHRLWIVGQIWPGPNGTPTRYPPAPNPIMGWFNEAYRVSWTEQLEAFLSSHGTDVKRLGAPVDNHLVTQLEYLRIWEVTGWSDDPQKQ